ASLHVNSAKVSTEKFKLDKQGKLKVIYLVTKISPAKVKLAVVASESAESSSKQEAADSSSRYAASQSASIAASESEAASISASVAYSQSIVERIYISRVKPLLKVSNKPHKMRPLQLLFNRHLQETMVVVCKQEAIGKSKMVMIGQQDVGTVTLSNPVNLLIPAIIGKLMPVVKLV
ncbi:MAG: hypothetical protein ACLUQY_02890, partial [Weissella confusa]